MHGKGAIGRSFTTIPFSLTVAELFFCAVTLSPLDRPGLGCSVRGHAIGRRHAARWEAIDAAVEQGV